jgi:hypothetical protein
MMDWKAQKRACDRAAHDHAHGGEDKREFYRVKGLGERYTKVFDEWSARLQAEREREDRLAPFQDFASRAEALQTSDNEEVRALADLLADMIEHFHEKESNTHG